MYPIHPLLHTNDTAIQAILNSFHLSNTILKRRTLLWCLYKSCLPSDVAVGKVGTSIDTVIQ